MQLQAYSSLFLLSYWVFLYPLASSTYGKNHTFRKALATLDYTMIELDTVRTSMEVRNRDLKSGILNLIKFSTL